MTQRENLFASAEAKTQADQGTATAERQFDFYARIVKYLWFVGAAIAFGALWVGRVQWNQSQHDKDITTLQSDTKINKALIDAHDGETKSIFATTANTTGILKSRVDAIESLVPEITEMWFMKEHGISNRASFFEKHGYAAPISPGETETPKQH